MSDPYLSDKLKPLFKMVVWNARKNPEQKDKVFAKAMKHIEDAGSITDSEVVRVFDEYAREFAKLGLTYEAEKLEKLARSTRQHLPNDFDAEGRQFEWWEQPNFVKLIPVLPYEIRASRVQPAAVGGLGAFLCVCLLLFFVLGLPFSFVVQPIFKALRIDDGIAALLFLLSLPTGAFIIFRWRDSRLASKSNGSWCKLTDDGIEFHEPGNSGKIAWSEIKDVWCRFDSGPDEDVTYDVTEIVGRNNKKISLSAQFYTDQEVKNIYAIAKLRSR